MTIIAVIGKPRTGKTLFLTAIGYFDYLQKRKIYSNYDLKFPYTRYGVDDLLGLAQMEMEFSPKTVVMQEASKWFDSRASGRRENRLLSSFTGQSGKRDIDIYYDDQFITRVDKGLRDVTDYSYLSNCVRTPNKEPVIFEYEMFGGYFLYPLNKKLRFPAQMMYQFYSMFNTREPTMAL